MGNDWFLIVTMTLTAIGFYCVGLLHGRSDWMRHWKEGFDAAKYIYEKR